MNYIIPALLALILFSCSEEESEKKEETVIESKDDLVEVKNGIFTEYYPGTDLKKIKFQGPQDEKKERHGIWYFYNLNNVQVSMTEYKHGIKNGVTMVKYDTGVIRYTGEYKDDQQTGIWKTYDSVGVLLNEKNYSDLK